MSKKVIIGLIILLVIGVGGYFLIGKMLWSPNVKSSGNKTVVYIPTNASLEDVMDSECSGCIERYVIVSNSGKIKVIQ
ncbi:MAG: hypothetical protein IPG48_04275 [Saprospiraceae bacterium]|nr:hypothetical protein [Saprospiraceae bacterium]